MKCPKCAHNQTRREGPTCQKCGYTHALNATGTTDGRFLRLLRIASQNDTAHFTLNQLVAAYNSPLSWAIGQDPFPRFAFFGKLGCGGLLLVLPTLWLATELESSGLALGAIVFGALMLLTILKSPTEHTIGLAESEILGWLSLWRQAGRDVPKLIEAPRLAEPPKHYREPGGEPDLYDYGVERIIVVERDILVDLLVLNNVHAERKALVLSESGYPSYLVERAIELLQQRPDLPVLLLHDCGERGEAMVERFLASDLLPVARGQVVDVGLRTEQVKLRKDLWWTKQKQGHYAACVDHMPTHVINGALAAHDGLVSVGALAPHTTAGAAAGVAGAFTWDPDTLSSFG